MGVTPQGIAVPIGWRQKMDRVKSRLQNGMLDGFVAQQNESILRSVVGHNRDIDIRPLALKTLKRQPVLGFYCKQYP